MLFMFFRCVCVAFRIKESWVGYWNNLYTIFDVSLTLSAYYERFKSHYRFITFDILGLIFSIKLDIVMVSFHSTFIYRCQTFKKNILIVGIL